MKRIAPIGILVLSGVCQAVADDAWVSDPPENLQLTNAMPELESSQFVEIPLSLADEAFDILATKPVLDLRDRYFPRSNFACAEPKRVYLVRAVYEHGDTGVFHVKQLRQTLWVLHYAFGAAGPRHKSALLVCTATAPTTIYVSAGGAM